jgi:hypothetical protein
VTRRIFKGHVVKRRGDGTSFSDHVIIKGGNKKSGEQVKEKISGTTQLGYVMTTLFAWKRPHW